MDALDKVQFTSSIWVFLVPSIMMLADIVTGLIYSWVKRKFKSSIMRQGLGKKAGELIAIAVANLVCYGTNAPRYIGIGVSVYVMVMEGMSICENLKKLGVKIPFINKILDDAAKKTGKEDNAK